MELQKESDSLVAYDNEMKQIDTLLKTKKDVVTDCEFQIKKSEHEQSRLEKDLDVAAENLKLLEREHEWIRPIKE
jgi:structural maintenance of chromosome 2